METRAAYLYDLGYLLKEAALEAKKEAEEATDGEDRAFRQGRALAYYEVLSLMEQQAAGLGIPLQDLRLEGFSADRDLL